MIDVIVTIASMDSHGEPNTSYVTTKVVRVEFDNEKDLDFWLDQVNHNPGVANVENLAAPCTKFHESDSV